MELESRSQTLTGVPSSVSAARAWCSPSIGSTWLFTTSVASSSRLDIPRSLSVSVFLIFHGSSYSFSVVDTPPPPPSFMLLLPLLLLLPLILDLLELLEASGFAYFLLFVTNCPSPQLSSSGLFIIIQYVTMYVSMWFSTRSAQPKGLSGLPLKLYISIYYCCCLRISNKVVVNSKLPSHSLCHPLSLFSSQGKKDSEKQHFLGFPFIRRRNWNKNIQSNDFSNLLFVAPRPK